MTLMLEPRCLPIPPCLATNPIFVALPAETILERFAFEKPALNLLTATERFRQGQYDRCVRCHRPYAFHYEDCGICRGLDKLLTAKGNHDTR